MRGALVGSRVNIADGSGRGGSGDGSVGIGGAARSIRITSIRIIRIIRIRIGSRTRRGNGSIAAICSVYGGVDVSIGGLICTSLRCSSGMATITTAHA